MWDSIVERVQEAEVFTRKFGSFSKSDYEVLMFSVYLDSLREPIRDYDISIALGITESKVRSLRVRSQLLYPRDFDWKEELAKSIENGYYNKETKDITITIENPSVQSKIKNEIEKNFLTVGLSLNSKQLILPIESFLLLAAKTEDNPQKTMKVLNSKLQKLDSNIADIEKKPLKARFLSAVPNLLEAIGSLVPAFQTCKPIIEGVQKLLGNYEG